MLEHIPADQVYFYFYALVFIFLSQGKKERKKERKKEWKNNRHKEKYKLKIWRHFLGPQNALMGFDLDNGKIKYFEVFFIFSF